MRLLNYLALGLMFSLPAQAIYVDGGIDCYSSSVVAQAETILDFWDVWDGYSAAAVYVAANGPQSASAQDSAWYPEYWASATATIMSPPAGTYNYDATHYYYDSWLNQWYSWQGPTSSCNIGGGGSPPVIGGIAVYPQSATDGFIAIYGTDLAPLTQTPAVSGVSYVLVDYESPSQVNLYYNGAASGWHYVTITTANGTSNQDGFETTSCFTPQNFHQVSASDIGGGQLRFIYAWSSPTQNLSHLSGCTLREVVNYPGGNPVYVSHSVPRSYDIEPHHKPGFRPERSVPGYAQSGRLLQTTVFSNEFHGYSELRVAMQLLSERRMAGHLRFYRHDDIPGNQSELVLFHYKREWLCGTQSPPVTVAVGQFSL